MKRSLAALALLLLVTPALADDIPVAPGSVGIQLLDVPVSRRNDPRALVAVVDHVHPGTVIERRVRVWNGTKERIHFNMMAGAATINGDEWLDDPFGSNELSSWVTFAPRTFTVRGKSSHTVLTTIRVPRDATAGERYGALFAITDASSGEGNLKTRSAVGIRMFVSVGPGGEPPSSFTVSNLRATPAAVLGDVHNDGARALDVSATLTLDDGPLSAGPFEGPATTIAVGATGTVVVQVPAGLPRGPWDAKLVLRSGRVVHELFGTITLPVRGRRTVELGTEGPSLVLAAGSAVLGSLALLALLLRRRKRRRRWGRKRVIAYGFELPKSRTMSN